MGEPSPAAGDQIVGMAEYLWETLGRIDSVIGELDRMKAELTQRRTEFAARLAVILAANDPGTQIVVEDYATRVQEDRPYEDSQDANNLIMEAHRRFAE